MKVKVNNLIINFECYNFSQNKTDVPFLVFLHGWQRSLGDFRLIGENLKSAGYNVLLLDLPGFGQSSLPLEPWTIGDYADFLKEFLEKLLKLDFNNYQSSPSIILIGHSFGGRIAIKFTAKYPQIVKKLILIASGGVKNKSTKNLIYKIIAKIFKNIFKILGLSKLYIFLASNFSSPDYFQAQGVMKQIFINAINEDLVFQAQKIKAPTLIIWGQEDEQLPVKDAFILQNAIEGSRCEIFKDAGHFLFLEKEDEFLKVISQFINQE